MGSSLVLRNNDGNLTAPSGASLKVTPDTDEDLRA